MKEFRTAEEMVGAGETALFIFTAGDDLELFPDGTGRSGYWKISATRRLDRVVIYLRDKKRPGVGDLYSGQIAGIDAKRADGRRLIHLQKMGKVGFTRENWRKFANTNVNPLRYVTASDPGKGR